MSGGWTPPWQVPAVAQLHVPPCCIFRKMSVWKLTLHVPPSTIVPAGVCVSQRNGPVGAPELLPVPDDDPDDDPVPDDEATPLPPSSSGGPGSVLP